MSIFPSTDIVLDVARAADPRKLNLAMKRLNEIGAGRAASASAFAPMIEAPKRAASAAALVGANAPANALEERSYPAKTPTASAAQKFEAFVLQSWLETILPKTESSSGGFSGAGEIWRSMMAEQLGAQLARAGGVGLQKIIGKDHASLPSSRLFAAPSTARG